MILQKCYRNSRPMLVTAHALGFGIYREPPRGSQTGLVQMFDQPALWEEIGYRVRQGRLAKGEPVVLERTDETSPRFLETILRSTISSFFSSLAMKPNKRVVGSGDQREHRKGRTTP